MKTIRCSIPFLLAFSAAASLVSADDGFGRALIFISDTQSPLWVETIRLERTQNEDGTRKLFTAISREKSAAALFHLGDITAAGSSPGQWKLMDRQLEKLRKARIPVYPALGNHDYLYSPEKGLKNFRKRFPGLKKTWYLKRIGKIAVVILNSNLAKLSEEERLQQERWYGETLKGLERESAMEAVVVCCHHSPFTNSKITGSSRQVRKVFVPPFLAHEKCKLFLSGHAHTFEHFLKEGKDFAVIGGGGGLLHDLHEGDAAKWKDLYPGKFRHFHFVRCEPEEKGLRVTVKMLKRDHSSLEAVYSFVIPWRRFPRDAIRLNEL